jgi:PIN domain nuclease of toxin-antitoxin system
LIGIDDRSFDALLDDANAIFISAATAWEIATKCRLGKLPAAGALQGGLDHVIEQQGFTPLPITLRHGHAAGSLPGPNKDPFDRMLMAQAMVEDLRIVSNETAFDQYGVRRLW